MGRLVLDSGSLRRRFNVAGRRSTNDFARKVQNRAKALAPVDTGRLRNSITIRRTFSLRGPSAVVGTDLYYAPYVEEGTRPHTIRPRTKTVLRFKMGNRIVYAREVNHPGTRARPFLSRALAEVARQEGYTLRRGIGE